MNSSTLKERLISYSLFSGAFLMVKEDVDAQVIYVDIEPDTILDIPGEDYYLDINSDGIDDIHFFNSSFDFFVYTPWWSYWTRQDLVARLEHSDISIFGLKEFKYSSFYAYYPFAIENGIIINETNNFNNGENQVLGLRTFYHSGDDTNHCFNCYWYNYYTPSTLDHFLGFKFIIAENFHYGWIRCDVKDEGRTLIIKDFAYELTPNNGIVAGDTTHFVSINENENALNANVYSFNNSIYVSLDEFIQDIEFHVYDVNGKNVYSDLIANKFSKIELNEPKGTYIVELISGYKIFTKKIFIN